MRRSRWLILAAILLIVIAVGFTYSQRKKTLAKAVVPPPAPLESGLEGRASDWVYTQSDGDRPRVTVRARSFRQIKAPSLMELEGVQLQIFHKEGTQFDLVKSDKAQFDIAAKSLYSEGKVEITMGMDQPANADASGDSASKAKGGRIVKIHSSGVRFASDTGRAVTEKPATFEFEQGGGSATGAEYDPMKRELHLMKDVVLDWKGKPASAGSSTRTAAVRTVESSEPSAADDAVNTSGSPTKSKSKGKATKAKARTSKGRRVNAKAGPKPIHVEAGEAWYLETESKVLLRPWAKLKRDTLTMEMGASEVTLENGSIQKAGADNGRGVQEASGRKVEFAADHLLLDFNPDMVVTGIDAQSNAKLISTAGILKTTVTSERIHLDFDTATNESVLTKALALGKSVAQSDPVARPGEVLADTRILRSDVIHLNMRAGGQEIDTVETDGAGTVDFIPNRPMQPKRQLRGDKIWIAYGAENRLQSFRSINAFTRTEKPGQKDPMLTQSKEIRATFDPKTSELALLEQKTDFRYEEGIRKAQADQATLEQATDRMVLDGAARASDPTGSVSADRIVMNQKTGDTNADGKVATTRQPEKKAAGSGAAGASSGTSSAMLSDSEVLQARAQKMTAREGNQKIHYEGGAVVWQGANRVEADQVDIDRAKQILEAHGKVVSQFADKDKAADKGKPKASPVFTVVRAPNLVYTGENRVAHYEGGAVMTRPGLTVTGKELRAFLKDSDAESSLDKAYADGAVKIVSSTEAPGLAKRTRTGTSEHGEYYADEQRVVLETGDPLLVDSVKGQTRGKQLIWFANNDRLLVNGVENRPADSLLRRK
jgi:lipopolysaccharide export system protein LptA